MEPTSLRYLKQFKLLILIAALLFISIHSSGQPNGIKVRINFPDSIKSIYNKYLLPPMNGAGEDIISFWTGQDSQPEYALRIIMISEDKYCLEGRFLTDRIDEIITKLIDQPEKPLLVEMIFYSKPVTKEFVTNFKFAFLKVSEYDKANHKEQDPLLIFDGTHYNFKINDEKSKVLLGTIWDFKEGDPGYNIIRLCSQIAKDIKNKSFDESKYIDKLK